VTTVAGKRKSKAFYRIQFKVNETKATWVRLWSREDIVRLISETGGRVVLNIRYAGKDLDCNQTLDILREAGVLK